MRSRGQTLLILITCCCSRFLQANAHATKSNIFIDTTDTDTIHHDPDTISALLDFASDTPFRKIFNSVISNGVSANPQHSSSQKCSSPYEAWIQSHTREIVMNVVRNGQSDSIDNVFDYLSLAMDVLTLNKLVYDKNTTDEYFGYDGRYTEEIMQEHALTELFWERSDRNNTLDMQNIKLHGLHGSDLLSDDKILIILQEVLSRTLFRPVTLTDAKVHADILRKYVTTYCPGGFDNPLLTSNAFAAYARSFHGMLFQDVIVVGDGLLAFLEDAGLDRDGPNFLHAHEYGHHLQYATDLVVDVNEDERVSLEEKRRKELMADAFSAYFLVHAMGGGMEVERAWEIQQVAFSVGTCPFRGMGASDHGTPMQRDCASVWGAKLAKDDKNEVTDPETFKEKFDQELEGIITLDVEACQLIVNNETITEEDHDTISDSIDEEKDTNDDNDVKKSVTSNSADTKRNENKRYLRRARVLTAL